VKTDTHLFAGSPPMGSMSLSHLIETELMNVQQQQQQHNISTAAPPLREEEAATTPLQQQQQHCVLAAAASAQQLESDTAPGLQANPELLDSSTSGTMAVGTTSNATTASRCEAAATATSSTTTTTANRLMSLPSRAAPEEADSVMLTGTTTGGSILERALSEIFPATGDDGETTTTTMMMDEVEERHGAGGTGPTNNVVVETLSYNSENPRWDPGKAFSILLCGTVPTYLHNTIFWYGTVRYRTYQVGTLPIGFMPV
jgi:hypothetical protein